MAKRAVAMPAKPYLPHQDDQQFARALDALLCRPADTVETRPNGSIGRRACQGLIETLEAIERLPAGSREVDRLQTHLKALLDGLSGRPRSASRA